MRKLRYCKWASPKMQQIMKQVGPSIQIFETVNFAFAKVFDFLIKTALLGAFLLFLGDLCHKLQPKLELGQWLHIQLIYLATKLHFRP